MFYRTICGLSLSIKIGLMAAFLSSVIALILGSMSAIFGGWIDDAVNFCVDLCMGVPHLVLLLLISIAVGGGANGVIFGVVCTHWPGLTRIVRAEVMQIRSTQYVQVARKMGKSRLHIAMQHIVPHVFPQYIVGLVLLFPHAILHEAGVTFLGYGLSLDTPAVGIILSESMKYLATGMWWLGFFPGDRSRRCSGCQTRKQSSILQIRCSRCSGRTWRQDHINTGTQRRDSEEDQHLLLICTELPHRHEIRSTDPKRTEYPNRI